MRFLCIIPFSILAILAMLLVIYIAFDIVGVVIFAGIMALLSSARIP